MIELRKVTEEERKALEKLSTENEKTKGKIREDDSFYKAISKDIKSWELVK